jgi:thymidylate synthase (FAD)
MKVSKISVQFIDNLGTDLSIVNAARVSFAKESELVPEYYEDELDGAPHPFLRFVLNEKDKKLVNYLAKHNHKSPFNHAFASFRVKAPIFVARQLVKHEYLPWNEVSRRYVTDEPEFYFPEGWRKAADNVKQGSSDEVAMSKDNFLITSADFSVYDEVGGSMKEVEKVHLYYDNVTEMCLELYNKLREECGVCPEQARMVLPQNTMTEWIWSGSLYAFAKMCKLRLDPHTQKETQEVAKQIATYLEETYPVSFKALMEHI